MEIWNGTRFTAAGWKLWVRTGGLTCQSNDAAYKRDILNRARALAGKGPVGVKHLLDAGRQRHLMQMNPMEV